MYRIGEFSVISKTTVKALRYYEKAGLLAPRNVDKFTGYRYYDAEQLSAVNQIVNLRAAGVSIKDIKRVSDSFVDVVSVIREQVETVELATKENTQGMDNIIQKIGRTSETAEMISDITETNQGNVESIQNIIRKFSK